MHFTNDFNGYAKRLQDELPSIELFALSISPLLTNELCKDVFSKITTHFDNVHKPETKGSMSNLENLIDELMDKYNNPGNEEEQSFRDRLERLRNDFHNEKENRICGEGLLWIYDEGKWPKSSNICRDLARLKDEIKKAYLGGVIQGCYIHKDKLIGIFVKTLDSNKYEDFLSVFVHELFHALHHFYLDKNGSTEILSEYYHYVVLESLATYFQIKYLEYKGYITKAEEIKSSVRSHSPIFNPYSGCELLFWYDNLFNKVLDRTKEDFEQALRQLVDKYDADIILEKKDYKNSDDYINIKKKIDRSSVSDIRLEVEYPDPSIQRIDAALGVLQTFFDGEWIYADNEIDDCSIILNGKVIHLFIVGQTENYGIESQRGHIYAPQRGYPNMLEVQQNDIIFSCQRAQIKSINVALESAEKTYGVEDGLRIDCIYSELAAALNIVPLRSALAGLSPFSSVGHLPQRGYIHHLDARAARLLMDEIKKLGNRPR